MANTLHDRSVAGIAEPPAPAGAVPAEAPADPHAPSADAAAPPDHGIAGPPSRTPSRPGRKLLLWAGAVACLAFGVYALAPTVRTMMDTVSTDDAFVNGHVTYVASRVPGQVSRVAVDDNDRVRKGDLLVQLDKEPYQVQVDIKKAALVAAEAELTAAQAQVRGILAQAGGLRWKLQRAMEDVDDKVALLRSRVATLRSKQASFDRARADLGRARGLFSRNAIAQEALDQRVESDRTAEAAVKQALEEVREARVSLGLVPDPEGGELMAVPANINQSFSAVRQALADLNQSVAQVGFPLVSVNRTPRQALDEFAGLDKEGNIDRILERMVPEAPAVKEAEAKILKARRDLAQAELDLRYCDVVSEIDGVVTGRSVNPGNNVSAGQSLMTVRSLTEIWIDANFKETQLGDLRIGQRVRCEVDMYGGRHEFEGRITGFTMGTGQTLSLLPPQNATGNFVKIVQRLPVKIELTDYDPDKAPLFVGLSVTPYVHYKEPPTGPHAGEVLRPSRTRPERTGSPGAGGDSHPEAPGADRRGGA